MSARGLVVAVALAASLGGAACASERGAPPAPGASAAPSSAPATVASARPAGSAGAACPDGMARVEAFCIDRYEAHLVDAGDPARALSPYERPPPGARVLARSRAGAVPQGYLNRFEAADACLGAKKRLCSAREWYRACGGPAGRHQPYGDVEVAGRCNTGKGHVMQKVFGNVAHFTFVDHYNSPRLNKEPGFLAASGDYGDCVTAEGVHDLVGNLHEWVADAVSGDLMRRVPLEIGAEQLGPTGNGVFMGGYFSSHGEHGAGCAYATTNHKPDYHDYSIGFRCCADAPPR